MDHAQIDRAQIAADQTDYSVFDCEISDEAVEIASGFSGGQICTLIYGSYCFTCVSEQGAVL